MLRYPVTKVVPFLPWREQIFLLWLSSSYQLWWWWDILLFFLTHFLFSIIFEKKWLRHFGDLALYIYAIMTKLNNVHTFMFIIVDQEETMFKARCYNFISNYSCSFHYKHEHDNLHYQIERSTNFICGQEVKILWGSGGVGLVQSRCRWSDKST